MNRHIHKDMSVEVQDPSGIPDEMVEIDEETGKTIMKMVEDNTSNTSSHSIIAKQMSKATKPTKCIALDENNICTVYDNRPDACRAYYCRHSYPQESPLYIRKREEKTDGGKDKH